MNHSEELTERNRKILDILKDGRTHSVASIVSEIFDPYRTYERDPRKLLAVNMTQIRKYLNPKGEDIVCEFRYRRMNYRWVIMKKS